MNKELADQLRNLVNKSEKPPVQEVKPIKSGGREGQTHLNFWVDNDVAYKVRLYCLQNNTNIKDFMIQLIDEKLK